LVVAARRVVLAVLRIPWIEPHDIFRNRHVFQGISEGVRLEVGYPFRCFHDFRPNSVRTVSAGLSAKQRQEKER
jgi:hypothetical protein